MPRRSCLAVGAFGGAHVVGPRGTLGAKKIYLSLARNEGSKATGVRDSGGHVKKIIFFLLLLFL